MRIATFNCNSVRTRLPIILDWLAAHSPDCLALQETKVADGQFPVESFLEAGWQVQFRGEKSYNGVAMVSREAPESVSFGLQDGDDGVSETRFAHITLDNTHILNTYVPQGQALDSEKFEFKLEWFARLRTYLETRFGKTPGNKRIVWIGDLNVAPTPIDVHDSKKIWPHVCHCQEVIDAFAPCMQWGFEDVFRKHLPDAETYTFWDYRVKNALDRGLGWRIDHILATPALAKTSEAVVVDTESRRRERPSDHTFVYADFA